MTALTDTHEGAREQPWHVTDALPSYIDGQLRGIVGIEFTVTTVEAKAKLSQNRSDADQLGVIAGLHNDCSQGADAGAVADAMQAARTP